jgi:hypothetical protein
MDFLVLPVRRATIYRNGTGYYERQGEVDGSTNVDVFFNRNELNKALKSLTVVDLSGGVVSAITYETLSASEELNKANVPIPSNQTMKSLLIGKQFLQFSIFLIADY